MSKKKTVILEDFCHMSGSHCETTSIRKVLNYWGYQYEEEFLLGIAGGPGFVNYYNKRMVTPFTGMRNGRFPSFLETLCSRLGFDIELYQTKSVNKSLNQAINLLEAGIPVISYGEIKSLPYFSSNSNFGQHAFVVYGIDLQKERVYISDRGGKPQIIKLDDYIKAHNAKCGVFSPNNAIVKIGAIHLDSVNMNDVVKTSILDTVHRMLYSKSPKFGIRGLYTWFDFIKQFYVKNGEKRMIEYLVSTFINIETAGTGEKGFRQMYSRFLALAADITHYDKLKEFADRYQDVADEWRKLSYLLLPNHIFGNLSDLLLEKENVFMVHGNYDTQDGISLLHQIDNCMTIAHNSSESIEESLILINQQIAICARLENQFYIDLEKYFVD